MITSPYLAIAGTLTAGAMVVLGVNIGMRYERSVWQERFIQQEEAQKEALLNREKLIAQLNDQYQEDLFTVEKEKERAIKQLKYDYSTTAGKRLSVPSTVCNGITTTSVTSGSSKPDDAVAGTVQLPEDITRNLFSEAYRADEIVESYRSLQHWIVLQGLYKQEQQ